MAPSIPKSCPHPITHTNMSSHSILTIDKKLNGKSELSFWSFSFTKSSGFCPRSSTDTAQGPWHSSGQGHQWLPFRNPMSTSRSSPYLTSQQLMTPLIHSLLPETLSLTSGIFQFPSYPSGRSFTVFFTLPPYLSTQPLKDEVPQAQPKCLTLRKVTIVHSSHGLGQQN